MTDEEKKAQEKLEQEKAALLSNIEEKAAEATKKEIEKFKTTMAEYATPEDLKLKFDGLKETIDKLGITELKDSLSKIEEAVETQSVELKKFSDNAKNTEKVNTDELIYKSLVQNRDKLAEFVNTKNNNHHVHMTLKASTVISSAVSGDTMAMRIPGIGILQRRQPYLRQLFTPGAVDANSHNTIRYMDQASRTSGAAAFAEGAAIAQSDIAWIERSIPIEEYGHYIKVSKRMLNNIDFTNTEIRNELLTGLNLAVDADLLTGTGVTPKLKGISSFATAFAAGSYAGEIQDAQLYDLITVIGAQLATNTNYMGTAALLNPLDATTKMKLKKDGENNYIIPPFVTNTPDGEMRVDGMRAIINPGVAENALYVGDFTRGTVYSGGNIELAIGFENDDFTKGLVTIRAIESLSFLVRYVDYGAFRYVSNIETALDAIEEAQA